MTVVLLPDVEALVVGFLLDSTDISDICGKQVYSVLPNTKTWPAVRVTRFGGVPRTQRPLYLDRASLQVEAFAGPKKTAWRLADTCRQVLAELPGGHDEGVVSAADFGGLAFVPDTEFTPIVNRYLFTVDVTCHPGPETGS